MARLPIPTVEDAPEASQPILNAINAQMGFVPNMFKAISINPTVLEGVTTLQHTFSRLLDAKTRHSIALAVSQINECEYCLAVHAFVAIEVGKMAPEDVALGRVGSALDPKRAAAAQFARQVTRLRGKVGDEDIAAIRAAGYTDPKIMAIIALAVQFLFTNFINNALRTDVDIPIPANMIEPDDLSSNAPSEAVTA